MSCPECFSGHIHEGNPRGEVVKVHGLDSYVTEPSDGRETKGIIVIIPDAFGWEFVNNRILADHYADKGAYKVYLPDFMAGNACPEWVIESVRTVMNPGSIFKKIYTVPQVLYGFVPFVISNRVGRSYPVVKKFFVDLRKNEAAALHIGVAGFCWGGKHVALLGGDSELVDGKPLYDAGFTAHPSMLTLPDDIEKLKRPVSFACPESDMQISLEQIDKIRAIVEAKPESQKGEVVLFKGCGHGFAIRADTGLADVAKQAADAEDQCIRWFDKHFGFSS